MMCFDSSSCVKSIQASLVKSFPLCCVLNLRLRLQKKNTNTDWFSVEAIFKIKPATVVSSAPPHPIFFSLKICHKASNGASNKAQVIQIIFDEILCPFVSQFHNWDTM